MSKEVKHYYFDLIDECSEDFRVIDSYLDKVFTPQEKEDWTDEQFPMTVQDWFFAMEYLSLTKDIKFNVLEDYAKF